MVCTFGIHKYTKLFILNKIVTLCFDFGLKIWDPDENGGEVVEYLMVVIIEVVLVVGIVG